MRNNTKGNLALIAIIWAIGGFVTWDPLWFIHGWFGRLVAVIILISILLD